MVKLNLQFFGGRGASSGGGGGGGGVSGGGTALETESLMSYRETDQATVDEVMGVFSDVYDQYGAQVEDIQLAKMDKDGASTLAYYDYGDHIAFNKDFFDSAKMDATYDRCVSSGFHPSRGNKTGLQAVAAHELGHKLTNDVAKKRGMGYAGLDGAAKLIMEDARKSGKFKGVRVMAAKISGYAKTSNAEAISEAFADVFCNGSKAKAESKAVVNSLNKFLK